MIDAKALGLRGTVASGRLAPAVVLRDPVCPVVQSVPGADIDEIEVGGNMKGRGRPEGGFKVNFAMVLWEQEGLSRWQLPISSGGRGVNRRREI